MQTQTSNTLHNAIMEAGGKDHPPMLALGNYVHWKSRIKRDIDTKPNHELIHYCLKNPPYKYTWADKVVPDSEGSSETTTERYMENYKNVSQDIQDQLNVKAEAVQIIHTGIDNDIYSTVDACPNACEMWKAIERFYEMMNELVRNQCDVTNHQVNVQFLLQLQPECQRTQQAATRNRGKVIFNSPPPIYDQEPSMVAEDDEMSKDKEIDKLVTPDAADNFGPIFDTEPLQKVPNNNNYNVFAIESEHPEQSTSVNDTYLIEQDEHNVIIDSLDTSYDREQIDQNDDDDDLANERDLLAPLIEKLKCEIDDRKNRNKFLETSNKVLVDKLKGKIEDFKTKNKSLESSNNRFKEANNKLSKTNELMYNDLKKFQAELDRYNNVKYASKFLNEIDRLSKEYYYADHMNAILGVYTELDEVTNLQCDYLETLEKCECLEKELSKSKMMSKSFEALQKHAINLELDLQQCQEKIKNDKSFKENQSKEFRKEHEQYFEIQDLEAQLQDKGIAIRVIPTTSVSRPKLKSNQTEDRVLLNNSQGKKQTLNVNFVCATCGKYVLNERHDMCVLKSLNGVNSRTKMPMTMLISTREPKRIVNQSVAKPFRKTVASESTNQKPRHTTKKLYEHVSKACSLWYPKFTLPGYKWKPKSQIGNVNQNVSMPLGNASRTANILEPMTPRRSTLVEIILFIVDFRCSKHMTGNLKLLINFMEKFLGTVKFGNDQIAPILGYGDLGNDLLTGSHGTALYSITLQDTSSPNPVCLMDKAISSQAWLWHRRLFHLNFDTINLLSKNDIVIGLLKLKFVKDHLCSSRITHQTSVVRTPEQNCVVERRNRTLIEAARKRLSAAKVPLFFWAEAIATTLFTQNWYSTRSRAYMVFNKRTRVIVETILVNFDELPQMASDHVSSDPVPQCQRTALEHDSLSPGPKYQGNVPQAAGTVTMSNELDLVFSLMFDELLNRSSQVVSKSSVVTTADAPNQCQQQHTTPLNTQTTPDPTCQVLSQEPTVTYTENINQAETITENAQVEDD
nr:hypothetical protein [Tanacetum cinerariifolium]